MTPVTLAGLDAATEYLGQCRPARYPRVRACQLAEHITRWAGKPVNVDAVLAAADAQGFGTVRAQFPANVRIGVSVLSITRLVYRARRALGAAA